MLTDKSQTMRTNGNLRIVILMSPLPLHNQVGLILLNKLRNVLSGAGLKNICLISGNVPVNKIDMQNIRILSNIPYDTRKDSVPVKVLKYAKMQILYSLSLIKNRNEFDMVFFWISSALFVPMVVAKILRKKTFVMATGNLSHGGLLVRIFERMNYFLCDFIGVESPSVVQHMNLERFKGKIRLFHLYVDGNFQMKNKFMDRDVCIGYIGRISKEKGIVPFLNALPLLIETLPDLKVLIGGSGPLQSSVESKVIEMKGNIKYVHWIPYIEMPNILNRLKLLVSPSDTEGLPNIMIESMACGTPVLATPVGGIPDLIEDGKTGFLLETNSSDCIYLNVLRSLNHPDLEKISENANRSISKKYSLVAASRNAQSVLNECFRDHS